jgi:hypothetical protein
MKNKNFPVAPGDLIVMSKGVYETQPHGGCRGPYFREKIFLTLDVIEANPFVTSGFMTLSCDIFDKRARFAIAVSCGDKVFEITVSSDDVQIISGGSQ